MSARVTASRELASDAIEDFFGFSIDAINQLQERVKELESQLEEAELMAARLEALR